MTVATATDVENRVGRPLTVQETARVEAYLEDAESEIELYGPDRLTDPDWEAAVIKVECAMVIRAARLPDALTSVVPDREGTGYESQPLTQGAIYLRRDERRKLGLPLVGSVQTTPCPSPEEREWPSTDQPWGWW